MTGEPNAEQLAIALMSEARKLQLDTGLGRLAMAERLAQWASDVRALGVRQAKLDKVRELAESWRTVEYGQGFARELAEVLDD